MFGHSFGLQIVRLDHSMPMTHLTFNLVEREGARKICDTICYTLLEIPFLLPRKCHLDEPPLEINKNNNPNNTLITTLIIP